MVGVGQDVRTVGTGRRLTIDLLIGEGGQGAVYRARPGTGEPLALKWYYPHTATAPQRRLIESLVDRGAPSERFLWPLELAEVGGDRTFGYVMALRPDRFDSLGALLAGKVDAGFATICRLCLELSNSFLLLHSQGLCYRDISFGNVFFDPATGAPLICDNDNVAIDGQGPVTVLGTRRFMAPEIVRREAVPSSSTDLYSLAVLLFYVLMSGHPLVGRRELDFACWDAAAESELFGRQPVFVFDPHDHSNSPDPSVHSAVLRYWDLYPPFVRDLFMQAFTDGISDPLNGRVRESVWRSASSRLLDSVQRCEACRRENFSWVDGAARRCWCCNTLLPRPVHMVVQTRSNTTSVAVAEDTLVSAHHLDGRYDVFTAVGRVVGHPSRPGVLGLRNETDEAWRGETDDGDEHMVEPGRSIRLRRGTRIDLGRARTISVD